MATPTKNDRLATLRLVITNNQYSLQEDVIRAMAKQGFVMTQSTLSRDMKRLKVAKQASSDGNYYYVLPNETTYRRQHRPKQPVQNLPHVAGFISLQFSGNMGVIRTRPGFASSIASNIDAAGLDSIIGTIAGDDTIFIVIREGAKHLEVVDELTSIIPEMVV